MKSICKSRWILFLTPKFQLTQTTVIYRVQKPPVLLKNNCIITFGTVQIIFHIEALWKLEQTKHTEDKIIKQA